MSAEWITLGVGGLAAIGEWLHAKRCRRLGRLAFGPAAGPRKWVAITPGFRAVAMVMLTWGLLQLWQLTPKAVRQESFPEGGYRHLIVALDVSPSMQLKDAGPDRAQTRAKRAAEVVLSMLERVALDQLRISVVAFYTGGKPVVVDTFDLEVVKNILNDLPLELAFTPGKTSLIEGIRESATLAKDWAPGSTTLVMVSDGDTVPDTGMPELPRAIRDVVVIGVGSAIIGTNIDGHMSRQDASTLRQVAMRLRGSYHDVNEKHLPSSQLTVLAKVMPMKEDSDAGKRELALLSVAIGSAILAFIPLCLDLAGSAWKPARQRRQPTSIPNRDRRRDSVRDDALTATSSR